MPYAYLVCGIRFAEKGGVMEENEKIADVPEILEVWTNIMRSSDDEKNQIKASEMLAKFLGMNEKAAAEKFQVNVIDDIV